MRSDLWWALKVGLVGLLLCAVVIFGSVWLQELLW